MDFQRSIACTPFSSQFISYPGTRTTFSEQQSRSTWNLFSSLSPASTASFYFHFHGGLYKSQVSCTNNHSFRSLPPLLDLSCSRSALEGESQEVGSSRGRRLSSQGYVTCLCALSEFPAMTCRIFPGMNNFIVKLVCMHVIFSKLKNN